MKCRLTTEAVLAPGSVRAFQLPARSLIRCINPSGNQVIDVWAFVASDISEFMSMAHSRLHMGRISPIIGSTLVTNRRRAILSIVADTSGGVHDTMLAACDRERYQLLGCNLRHSNCADNVVNAMKGLGHDLAFVPDPLNLFENVPVAIDGTLEIRPPVAQPGSYIEFRADVNQFLVVSVCPQDLAPTNGAGKAPSPIKLQVMPFFS
jgi:uncharacterized protein YcgI (DUF1989 family)